ncbi:Ionotropic receptor 143 [Diabrotica virgifera virgifera]|nr:Ionotropic receptor 143 [Diabrotica virgifera virgifera]
MLTPAFILGDVDSKALEKCVDQILSVKFSKNDRIYLVNTDLKISYPAINFNTEKEQIFLTTKPTMYIISDNFTKTVHEIYEANMFNPLALYIFVSEKLDDNMTKVFQIYSIQNALMVTNFVNISTQNFDTEEQPVKKRYTIKFLKMCLNYGTVLRVSLQKKSFTNLKILCALSEPYVISTEEGIHIDIIKEIAKNLKIKPTFYKTDLPGHSTRIVEEFNSRNYDVYATPTAIMYPDEYFYTLTDFITEDHWIMVLPRVESTYYLKLIFQEFTLAVWICFLVLLFFVYFLFWLNAKIIPHQQKVSLITVLLPILLDGSANITGRNLFCRTLFIVYLVFATMFTTAYKTKLFVILKDGLSYQLYKSEDDILKYKLKVGIRDMSFTQIYKHSTLPFLSALYKNHLLKPCGFYLDCVNITATEKNLVSTIAFRQLQYFIPDYFLDNQGRSLVLVFGRDRASSLLYSLVFRRDHPLIERFNEKLTKLREGGFAEYLHRKFERRYNKAINLATNQDTVNPLSLENLETIFLIYLVGLTLCFVVFIMEKIYQKFIKKKLI